MNRSLKEDNVRILNERAAKEAKLRYNNISGIKKGFVKKPVTFHLTLNIVLKT